MNPLPGFPVSAVLRVAPADDGASVDIIFKTDEGEEVIRFPFEVIADVQVALAHARRALLVKRKEIGADDLANLIPVKGMRARDVAGDHLRLELNSQEANFQFLLSPEWAADLARALTQWCSAKGVQAKPTGGAH